MVLSMPRPYKHPKTGVYWYRQRVPKTLISTAKGIVVSVSIGGHVSTPTLGQAIQVSLRTKDVATAKALAVEAQSEFDRIWSSLKSGSVRLSHKEVVALSGEIYRTFTSILDDNPGSPEVWKGVLETNAAVSPDAPQLTIGNRYRLRKRFRPFVDWVLQKYALKVEPDSYEALIDQTAQAMGEAADLLQRRAKGDYRPDTNIERFPELDIKRPAATSPAPSRNFLDLFRLLDHKAATQSMKHSTVRAYKGALRDFAKQIGHSDAEKVTVNEVRSWRDRLQAQGLEAKTINGKYLAALKAVLNHGRVEFQLDDNAAANIQDARSAATKRRKSYTLDEARTILEATFRGTSKDLSVPHRRALFWVPWICAYTGMRVSEAIQLQGRSVRTDGKFNYLMITPEDGSTKGQNAWIVPVHPHLVELGLLDMFSAMGDGPAFYTPYPPGTALRALTHHRSSDVGSDISEWVRTEVGVEPPNGRPNHAWRHLFTSLSRIHKLDKEARDYMMGSQSKTDAREGYGDWPPEALDIEIRKLPRFQVIESAWRPSLLLVKPTPSKKV